jgi:hypothetical protein
MPRAAISLTTGLEDAERVTVELLVRPLCFNAKRLDEAHLVPNARLGGTVQLWEWIDDGATTFSY